LARQLQIPVYVLDYRQPPGAGGPRRGGAGFFPIFRRIILPMSTPIIMVCLIWQFTQIWNDCLCGVVFSSGDSQPITVALNNLVNTSTGAKEYNVDMEGGGGTGRARSHNRGAR